MKWIKIDNVDSYSIDIYEYRCIETGLTARIDLYNHIRKNSILEWLRKPMPKEPFENIEAKLVSVLIVTTNREGGEKEVGRWLPNSGILYVFHVMFSNGVKQIEVGYDLRQAMKMNYLFIHQCESQMKLDK